MGTVGTCLRRRRRRRCRRPAYVASDTAARGRCGALFTMLACLCLGERAGGGGGGGTTAAAPRCLAADRARRRSGPRETSLAQRRRAVRFRSARWLGGRGAFLQAAGQGETGRSLKP